MYILYCQQMFMCSPKRQCKKKLFAEHNYSSLKLNSPSKIIQSKPPMKFQSKLIKKKLRIKNQKKRNELLNILAFEHKYKNYLGPYVTEFCKLQLLKCKLKRINYTQFQKWLAMNIMLATSNSGYRFLSNILPLPTAQTVLKCFRIIKSKPGILKRNAATIKVKVNSINDDRAKFVFILLDEMSLRTGFTFDQSTDTVFGFSDDGVKRSRTLASSTLCIMVVGVVKRWKYPLGFYFTGNAMKAEFVIDTLKQAIDALEEEGFVVLGATSDQGSNFRSAFKKLGVTPNNPYMKVGDRKYLVLHDPPHLLKSARNFLEKKDVAIPNFTSKASWNHIKYFYHLDEKSSFRLAPKLSEQHVSDLKFASKMKVKIAANVLSNTVARAIKLCVERELMEPSAKATMTYLKRFNDMFDILNSSSPFDDVEKRKPLHMCSEQINYLKESAKWILEVKSLNTDRVNFFLDGWVQSINAVLELSKILSEYDIHYLSTRNLCQDHLEMFFGKIRQVAKFPDCYGFAFSYGRISSGSLIRAPLDGNCEVDEEHLEGTIQFLNIDVLPVQEESTSFEADEGEILEALHFSGTPNSPIGGINDSVCSKNACSYFSGYLGLKLNKFHRSKLNCSITDCEGCNNIFVTPDMNLHLFISFKEYEHNVDSS